MSSKGWRMGKHKMKRQVAAKERQAVWDQLTVGDKFLIISSRPGNSSKEVAKLHGKRTQNKRSEDKEVSEV